MGFLAILQDFWADLRREGIPITISQAEDCCRALKLVDWSIEEYFYMALYSTLIRERSHQPIFANVYAYYFKPGAKPKTTPSQWKAPIYRESDLIENVSEYASEALPVQGMQALRGGLSQGTRNPLDQSFQLADLHDIRKMESLFPLIARRLAARMIKQNRRNDRNIINYRRTVRNSMGTGGVPFNIITCRKHKEKPVIIALCDISGSVMTFSCFALALLASIQRFFRQVRTFAFIEELTEITPLLTQADPLNLRNHVLHEARQVMGVRGYTNYGASFRGFIQRYRHILSPRASVLILGDGRNNWNYDEAWALAEISKRVKRVYWLNPEPEFNWARGDSRMVEYCKFCYKSFSCPSLSKLEHALAQL
ncbi:MAG: VWA domain-containing protein [Syntrophomonadaceae bacterium]|nr:VWA domain-containing protein [Syntrophomonadaceae bacterium]